MSIETLQDYITYLMHECPWTSKQTFKDIKSHTREETEELMEAIDSGDMNHIRDECGDLLLQVLFYAGIAEKNGDFTFKDVVKAIEDKLKYRYGFIETALEKEGRELGDATPEELDALWQKAKKTT